MTAAPPPGRVRLVLEDFKPDPDAGTVKVLLVYPSGSNARWLIRELLKLGAGRPARRWPDGVWFHYSTDTLRIVEETVMRVMRVGVFLPAAGASVEHMTDERVSDLEDLMEWSDGFEDEEAT